MIDGLKVLLAEDQDTELYHAILRSWVPNRYTIVTNGEDLVTEFKKGGYGVVISDNDMPPGIKGADALIQINLYEEANSLLKVPKYLMTAGDVEKLADYLTGVATVLGKPVPLNDLKGIISPCLQ